MFTSLIQRAILNLFNTFDREFGFWSSGSLIMEENIITTFIKIQVQHISQGWVINYYVK